MPSTPIQALDEQVMSFAPEQIWPVLVDVASYPCWWPSSISVRVVSATPDGTGSEVELTPRGGQAFRCKVESMEAPRRIAMRYGGGFVTGTGEWRLEPVSDGTRVVYELDVAASGWMVALIARATSLGELHSKAMREVLEALEREVARRKQHS